MNEFEGTLVRLRAYEPEDWEPFFALYQDTDLTRADGNTHLPWSRAAVRQWVADASQPPTDDQARLIIETRAGQLVGSIDVGRADRRTGVFSYGLVIAPEHRRLGYATEAINLLLRHYFLELGYHKADVEIYDHNEPSIRLHEAIGFVTEGRRRDEQYTLGRYHDLLLFGMTADEFQRRAH